MIWKDANPEQAEDRLHRDHIVIDLGPLTPLEVDARVEEFVTAKRRYEFLMALENYVPRRPRTYRDRKWLEGYSLTAAHITNFQPCMMTHVISSLVQAYANPRYYLKITQESRGAVDAFLDAVGC